VSWRRQRRNTPWLFLAILLALVYGALLYFLRSLTGYTRLDGVVGIVLGVYICSHPAANIVDLIILGRTSLRQNLSRWAYFWWWVLNFVVLLTGIGVIFSGTIRFTVVLPNL
jgi:hypothetical protein